MADRLRRLRDRLTRADTGRDFADSCCHRIGGVLRAGPPADHHTDGSPG
jgi:hypothetical protein